MLLWFIQFSWFYHPAEGRGEKDDKISSPLLTSLLSIFTSVLEDKARMLLLSDTPNSPKLGQLLVASAVLSIPGVRIVDGA